MALEKRNLFLTGDGQHGFVVLDHHHNVYSLSRVGGIKKKDLKARQMESREKLIFRQNREQSELQKNIVALRVKHRQERALLAKRVYEFRQSEVKRTWRSTDFDQWTKARNISKDFEKVSFKKGHSIDAPKKPSRDKPARQRTRRRDLE